MYLQDICLSELWNKGDGERDYKRYMKNAMEINIMAEEMWEVNVNLSAASYSVCTSPLFIYYLSVDPLL